MNGTAPARPETRPRQAPDAAGTGPSARPAEERGATVIAARVIEKTAAHAAAQLDQVYGLSRRMVGVSVGAEHVRADAEVDGQVVSLRVQLGAAFPTPLVTLTREVREHVTAQVQQLCGVRVDHIDITVAALRHPSVERRRVQ